jgi:hypothetical protein
MSDRLTVSSNDPAFFEEVWEEFIAFVEEDHQRVQLGGRPHAFTQALEMALDSAEDSSFRDQAFFKLGCAWVMHGAQKGILQRVPQAGNGQAGLS